MSDEESQGLTFPEWCIAADTEPTDDAYWAWVDGEDPCDWALHYRTPQSDEPQEESCAPF